MNRNENENKGEKRRKRLVFRWGHQIEDRWWVHQVDDFMGSLFRKLRKRLRRGAWSECEGTVLEHELREAKRMRGGLDAEVPKHSVRLPASKQLDDVGVDTRHEQGSGPARA